jgi:hypothetical protein
MIPFDCVVGTLFMYPCHTISILINQKRLFKRKETRRIATNLQAKNDNVRIQSNITKHRRSGSLNQWKTKDIFIDLDNVK